MDQQKEESMHATCVTWLAEQLDRIGADGLLLRLLRKLPRWWLDDLPPWLRFRAGILQPPFNRITTALPLPGPEVFAAAAASSLFALKVALRSLAIELDRRLASTKHDPEVFLYASRELINDLNAAGHALCYFMGASDSWSEEYGTYDPVCRLWIVYDYEGTTMACWDDALVSADETDDELRAS
jgi:hypothetical protein